MWDDSKPCDEAKQTKMYFGCGDDDDDIESVWIIEINTLNELLEFRNKYGNIILEKSSYRKNLNDKEYMLEIEIYDDYREQVIV